MRKLHEFIHDERGSPTIEFVLWVPVFVFFLCFTVDASLLYLTHTEMFTVARTTARQISVGALKVEDAQAYAKSRILLSGRTYTIGLLSGSLVIVDISVNVGDATVFGMMEAVLGFGVSDEVMGRTMSARVQMRREPTISTTTPLGV